MGNRVSGGVSLFNDDGSLVIEATGRIRVAGGAGAGFIAVQPGVDQAAEIQAAVNAAVAAWRADPAPEAQREQRTVRLGPGVFYISVPVEIASTSAASAGGVRLGGQGRLATRIEPHASWVDGDVDDPFNGMILVVGARDPAGLDTRLTNAVTPGGVPWYGAGARQVSVAATGALAPGDWIDVHGWETGVGQQPGGNNGRDIIVDELIPVTAVTGLVLTLATSTVQHHVTVDGPGAVGDEVLSVQRVRPALDVEIVDLTLDSAGRTIACGVTISRAARVLTTAVGCVGMTRMGVEHRDGARDCRSSEVYIEGCNGGIAWVSANTCRESGTWTSMTGPRFREIGVIRAGLWLYRLSVDIQMNDFNLQNMCVGVWLHAMRTCSMTAWVIQNMDITEKFARDGLDGGIAVQMGTVATAETVYGDGLVMKSGMIKDCRCPQLAVPFVPRFFTIYYHDVYNIDAGGIEVTNDGVSPYTTINGDSNYYMPGPGFQDCNGTFSDHVIKGCEYGITIRSAQGAVLKNWTVTSGPGGGGTNPVVGLFLASTVNTVVRIDGLSLSGGIYFSAGFTIDDVDNIIDVRNLYLDSVPYVFEQLVLVRNRSGDSRVIGDALKLEPNPPGGIRSAVVATANGDPAPVVVVMPFVNAVADGAPMFVSTQGAFAGYARVAGTANYGDKLILQAAGPWLAVSAAAPADVVFGRSLTQKTTAPLGPVRTSPT